MKKWMCYYVNVDGYREGSEYIDALTKEDARKHYIQFFNISKYDKVVVIPFYGDECK